MLRAIAHFDTFHYEFAFGQGLEPVCCVEGMLSGEHLLIDVKKGVLVLTRSVQLTLPLGILMCGV